MSAHDGKASELDCRGGIILPQTASVDLWRQAVGDIDLEDQTDLRRRLANAIERGLGDEFDEALLPSIRSLARVAGVHRNTARAALEILVDRSVLHYASGGRFVVARAETRKLRSVDALRHVLSRAALVASETGLSEARFLELSQEVYREQGQTTRPRVVFVEYGEKIPGFSSDELARMLDYPVVSESKEQLTVDAHTMFVATSFDATAVRDQLRGRAEVFTVGLAFDMDIRIAVSDLVHGAQVALAAEDHAVMAAAIRRVMHIRPDVTVQSHIGTPVNIGDAMLLLASTAVFLDEEYGIPVARYQCAIFPGELAILRARLNDSRAAASSGRHYGTYSQAVSRLLPD